MLVKRFRDYLDKVFSPLPDTKEIQDFRAELLDNLMSHALDLQKEGYDENEIYSECINSLGDYSDTLKSFKSTPKTILRDTRVWRNVLYALVASILVAVTYLVIGFTTGKWGLSAVIMFPALLGGLYIIATAFILIRNIGLKKNLFSGAIISSYFIILVVIAYLILSFAVGFPFKKTWVVFAYIPAFIGASSMITFKFLRKKRIPLVVTLFEVMAISVAAYLTVAVHLWQFHPYWIITVIGAVIDLLIIAIRIDRYIKKKKNA